MKQELIRKLVGEELMKRMKASQEGEKDPEDDAEFDDRNANMEL